MTQEKQLLLKDLCARLPYRVIGAVPHYDEDGEEVLLQGKITGFNEGQIKFEYLPDCTDDIGAYNWFDIDLVKPYLRPLSSMTEEEMKSLPFPWTNNFGTISSYQESEGFAEIIHDECSCIFDWLNKNMFDYRGLIPKGFAISTEEFNPYKDYESERNKEEFGWNGRIYEATLNE